jgi:CubicO group peptidase (beta-lactamase class C family)
LLLVLLCLNSTNKKGKMKIKLTTVLLVISQIVQGQTAVEGLDSLFNYLHNNQLFNGNVLIAEKGKVIYKKSFGYANFETKEHLNENTTFYLASITKQFTAMGIVILKERGLLSYKDSLSKFIPELSFYQDITIKHLLHHTGVGGNFAETSKN